MLDGVEIGRLHKDEIREFAIPSGRHTLRLAIDWSGSEEVTFTVAPGETARFSGEQKPGFPVFHAFTRHGWISLTPDSDAP
jgi:hypothetical protein